MKKRRTFVINTGGSVETKENALELLSSLIGFFAGDCIIFSKACPKTIIITLLEKIKKNLSKEDECTVKSFFDGIIHVSSQYHLECIEGKMKISCSWVNDCMPDLNTYNQSKMYKGKYSVEFSTLESDSIETNKPYKLRIDWYLDNFVVHFSSISHENTLTGVKHYFLPMESDAGYFEVFKKNSGSIEFMGTLSFLDILFSLLNGNFQSFESGSKPYRGLSRVKLAGKPVCDGSPNGKIVIYL